MPEPAQPRDDSKYRVALELLDKIASCEGVALRQKAGPPIPGSGIPATREWILKSLPETLMPGAYARGACRS